MALVALAAGAAPLYDEAVSDDALGAVLGGVPRTAAASVKPVVRVNTGVKPTSPEWADLVDGVAAVPGMGVPRVTGQSISTELNNSLFYDPVTPVLSADGNGPAGARGLGGAPVRLFGVDDPQRHLVVVASAPDPVGVWVRLSVARALGVSPGDQVFVHLSGRAHSRLVPTAVAGTYRTTDDGRTPQNPPGDPLWQELVTEGFPTEAVRSTLRANLLVADLDTTERLARRTKDTLLWSVQSRLTDPRPTLAEFRRTADGVAALRVDLATHTDVADLPASLRPGLASGVETLAEEADSLASAAQKGTAPTTRLGIGLALAVLLAGAAWTMGRRRREVSLAAGTGRTPAAFGAQYAVELVPAAILGGVLGWAGAQLLVRSVVRSAQPTGRADVTSAWWCAGAVVAAVLAGGAVAAVALVGETRRLHGRSVRRVPWTVLVVVLAVTAMVGLVTRPRAAGEALGPLDVLVPPLLLGAVAAVGTRIVFALARWRRGSARAPTARRLPGWLARRRLRSPDEGREIATTIVATGLAMLVFALAARASVGDTVEDRAAEDVGARSVYRVSESYQLDPRAPQAVPPREDGQAIPLSDVPDARNPTLPSGQTVVWRGRADLATTQGALDVLAVDPASFAAAADWGSPGGALQPARSALGDLQREEAARDSSYDAVPGILVGQVGDLDLDAGQTITLQTLHLPASVRISSQLEAFPGAGSIPTLVVPADAYFGTQLNDDPRLRPAPGGIRNVVLEYTADLWSSSPSAAAATLAQHDVEPDLVGDLSAAKANPVYVAAEQSARYQVALGLFFGALALATLVLGAVRLTRRAPAADRMLGLAGAGVRAPAVARVLETVVVLALAAGLAVLGLLALRPLASILLEPGDARVPAAALRVPDTVLLLAGGWAVLALVAAALSMALATSSQPTVEVLRGSD